MRNRQARSPMLWFAAAALACGMTPRCSAQPSSAAEVLPAPPPAPSSQRPAPEFRGLMSDAPHGDWGGHEGDWAGQEFEAYGDWPGGPVDWRDSWWVDWLGTRSSKTHGRAIGPGQPLRGTSWLNRPLGFALEFGGLIMVGNPAAGVASNNDVFAAIRGEWDWDHYWGGQVRIGWSTPEFGGPPQSTDDNSDNLFISDVSVQYYPWGDSRTRPYCRVGVGLTALEFTAPSGVRQEQQLFTVPIAIGVKRQIKRSLVGRAEFANNLAVGQNGANSLNNITFTLGVEGRFGGRPSGYWAWSPRGRGW